MNQFLSHFTFAQPFWLLLLLPCVALVFLRRGRGADSALAFSNLSVLRSLGARVRQRSFGFGLPLLFASLVLGIFAMARPVWRDQYQTRNASGIDIMLTLDISLSMSIDDFFRQDGSPVQRIDLAKEVVRDFISKRPDDRIGLVVFSGRPYAVSPITLDHQWLKQGLEGVHLDMLKEMGTAIGSALAASTTRLDNRDSKSKIIVLITDGASNSGKLAPVEAAEYAKALGIKIYTIAIGTEEGRVSRGIQRFPRQEFDLPSLRKIAALTGGEHYWAKTTASFEETFRTIDELEKTKSTSQTVTEDQELFWYVLLVSGLLGLIGAAIFIANPPPAP
jgi:Ca-activated chloride channel homolog